ncbi:MAG: hypothetical protein JWM80_2054 [Cyanobacteria bacterium RYN_339]|nr:hypothetical protein [Cyanobacteria bacterium RYN_339]
MLPPIGLAAPVPQRRALPAPAAAAKARAATTPDPLPRFKDLDAYKTYVIFKVGKAKLAQGNLDDARKALNQGIGTRAAVETALADVDGLLLQLTILRDQYQLPWTWTLFGLRFDKAKFWAEQATALPTPGTSLPTPVAEPVAAPAPLPPLPQPTGAYLAPLRRAEDAARSWAQQAGGDAAKAQAMDAFKQAADACLTPAEAQTVAASAMQWKYYREGVYALDRGLALTPDPAGAVAIAKLAADACATKTSLYKPTAQAGFRQAADGCTTYQQALGVANDATQWKYHVEAVYAMGKALDLTHNWTGSLAIARQAAENVRSNVSVRYGDPARRGFRQAADQCPTAQDAYQVAALAKQYGYDDDAAYATQMAEKLQ